MSSAGGHVHVTTAGRRRGPAVIHVHETRTLHADDIAAVTTSPARVSPSGRYLGAPVSYGRVHLWVEGHEVDAYWPEHRLVVEVDSITALAWPSSGTVCGTPTSVTPARG